MQFERRARPPIWLTLGAPLIAVAVALLLAGGLIALSGAPVFEAFGRIASSAFGSRLALTETLTRTTPLILTGLAAAVAFRARVWNIGAEGQFYLGAFAAVWAARGIDLPWPLLIPVLMLTGALAGVVLLVIPVILRLRSGVDEVVTTLLLNFIVLLFVSLAVEGFLRDPMAFGWPKSVPLPADARLDKLVAKSRLHTGLFIALACAVAVWALDRFSVFGLRSRAAGAAPEAAAFAGVPLGRTLVKVACLSGGLAGLAGAIEVMGVRGYLTTDLSPGFGYSGIVVAMLANLNALGVVAAALFVAAVFVGTDGMSRALEVPSYIADVTVSLSLLAMLVALFFAQWRIRR
ncbi:ABC transporter permease [Pseudooceanicola sp. 216_PA32_1]|uniref:ABC transporter permease n=1 Tax=Pseudooceanicola pacificus TaxID=2676438 RepID=A0A844VYN0_9RHOB|nr:ABC transporter permease [Pseudooceanicola pacificus]MWB76846.1 ABC transporter permease [Pseudooceanicola pacificus]